MRTLLTSLLAVAILATGAFAQNITGVTPSSGAIGTDITITGTGFGTKKPTVFLTSHGTVPKKYPLKVTANSDTSIVATVSKGIVGSFDVSVKVGPTTVSATDAFALVPPSITAGQTATADVGTNVTLNGSNFGTTNGKVVVGAQKAPVVTWTDMAITFTVPTTIPNGAVVVEISNRLGGDSISGYLTVTGSNTPLATNKVTGAVGGKRFKPRIHFVFVTGNDWTLQMKTLGKHARTLSFAIFDLTSIPGIYHGTETRPATLALDIAGGGGSFTGRPGEFTITITHREGKKFGGVISGTVASADNKTVAIQSVQFIYDTGL